MREFIDVEHIDKLVSTEGNGSEEGGPEDGVKFIFKEGESGGGENGGDEANAFNISEGVKADAAVLGVSVPDVVETAVIVFPGRKPTILKGDPPSAGPEPITKGKKHLVLGIRCEDDVGVGPVIVLLRRSTAVTTVVEDFFLVVKKRLVLVKEDRGEDMV